MSKCRDKYISGMYEKPEDGSPFRVLDVGGANVNGSYGDIFIGDDYEYKSADIDKSADIWMEDPYKIPVKDDSFDLVISGQMFEHCEFFWLIMEEMVRVVKPGHHVFIIAPSAGDVHRYPVDCWRFLPDSYPALARWAKCELIESWRDERDHWKDMVGIFRKPAK